MSVDAETLAFYRQGAAAYSEFSRSHAVSRRLRAFAGALPAGAAVLDLGCGPGWAARWLAAQGFGVTALDPVPEFLAPLRAEGIDCIEGGALDLARPGAFSGIWSDCALQHLPRAEMPAALDRVAEALLPGGRLVLSIHEGEDDLRDRLGRLYTHWSEARLRALMSERGLTTREVIRGDYSGYDGRPITVMTLTADR